MIVTTETVLEFYIGASANGNRKEREPIIGICGIFNEFR
jgi:hypothetical protein